MPTNKALSHSRSYPLIIRLAALLNKQGLSRSSKTSKTSITFAELSRDLKLSEQALHSTVSAWSGLALKDFLPLLTHQHTQHLLSQFVSSGTAKQCQELFKEQFKGNTAKQSSPQPLSLEWQTLSPHQYQSLGKELRISYGTVPSHFGSCFIASIDQAICKLAFFDKDAELQALKDQLYKDWYLSEITQQTERAKDLVDRALTYFDQQTANQNCSESYTHPLKIMVKGSEFQIKVWEALLTIPPNSLCSYSDLAEIFCQPQAVRAISSAVAKNDIALLIPCHRVIRKGGQINQYRWGANRKRALIAYESARKLDSCL